MATSDGAYIITPDGAKNKEKFKKLAFNIFNFAIYSVSLYYENEQIFINTLSNALSNSSKHTNEFLYVH